MTEPAAALPAATLPAQTAPEPVAAVVFDAFGTLFDVNSVLEHTAGRLGPEAAAIAASWRLRQLEYSWLRSLSGHYVDFWQITGDALDYALALHGRSDPALRALLMERYLALAAWPDAGAALAALRQQGLKTAILSNGSPTMLAAVVDANRLRPQFDAVLSVEAVRVYKPHARVYQLACDRLGLPAERIAFVSANGWDVAGAACFGFRTIWLNRSGAPAERLPGRPVATIGALAGLPAAVAAITG